MKIPHSRTLDYTKQQPGYSKFHNCTAAIMDDNMFNYPWVTIPCDEKYRASYICQPRHIRNTARMSIQSNVTCNGNWFLPEWSEKCLLLLSNGNSKISYHNSQEMCSLYNASVFKINVSDRVNAVKSATPLKAHLLHQVKTHPGKQFSYSYLYDEIQNMPALKMQNILFGRRVDRFSPQSMVPYYIYHVDSEMSGSRDYMSFFADFNNTCSVVEYTTMSYAFADALYPGGEWGVKCRPCSSRIKVTGTICEKPSELNVVRCKKNHYECGDKSCILHVYKCDHIVDCFDNSDEAGCDYGITTILTDLFVTLPCIQRGICDIDSQLSVHVHAICDGLYYNNSFMPGREVCMTFNSLKIKPAAKSQRRELQGEFTLGSKHFFELYLRERILTCTEQKNAMNMTYTDVYDIFLSKMLPITENTILNDACMFNGSARKCYSATCRKVCKMIACPGMFKCGDNFCILLSSVCDNRYDCMLGEDEHVCLTLTCPGSLKCRGENRCISTDEICDKHVNCLYSMDDEMGCDTCPGNCECRGYVVSCYSTNTDHIIQSDKVLYTKGLVVKGTQNVLITKYLKSVGLLFLNISSCKLNKIDVSHTVSTHYFILIADFSHNQLIDITFIKVQTFTKILFLDLSFNLLHTLQNKSFASLRYLSVILLHGNKIKYFFMKVDNPYLTLIDLQLIYYVPDLVVSIYHGVPFDLGVKVSDSQLCCMLQDHIKCLSTEKNMQCHGILDKLSTRVAVYTLSLLSLCFSICTITRQVLHLMPSNKRIKTNRHYSMMVLNQSVDYILCSLYLAGLSVIDMVKINLLVFKTSLLCIVLNAIIYISLETIIVFKSSLSGLILLKIMFPFKHQCTWLKWIVPMSGCIWIFAAAIYLIHIFLPFKLENQTALDNLCSIGWCGMHSNYNMLHIMIYIVDILMIFNYITVFIIIFKTLKTRTKVRHNKLKIHYTAGHITCKLICVNIGEILLRFYLITMLSMQIKHFRFVPFCLYFFLYALPINILYSCFAVFFF